MKRNMWYTRFINDNKVDMYCGHTFEQTYSFRLNKKKNFVIGIKRSFRCIFIMFP